ncbi:hypothetical protein [Laspinema palackyanum]|nr:hypothetical protein [Laspinema sp. D2c]
MTECDRLLQKLGKHYPVNGGFLTQGKTVLTLSRMPTVRGGNNELDAP